MNHQIHQVPQVMDLFHRLSVNIHDHMTIKNILGIFTSVRSQLVFDVLRFKIISNCSAYIIA